MLDDNGWTIEYDMILARMLAAQHLGADAIEIEPEQIIGLLQDDQKKYLETIQQWNIKRIERLKAEGWRKAQGA
jgi:hypothetical protein